jgi:hypothetical protein
MKAQKIILFCLLVSVCNFASGQVKKKTASPLPIIYEGNHAVQGLSKSIIFNKLLSSEQKRIDLKESSILAADPLKILQPPMERQS